jgi:hypothetical protein
VLHPEHATEPGELNLPGEHSTQLLLALNSAALPPAQSPHVLCPASENFPLPHAWHDIWAVVSWNNPAVHALQYSTVSTPAAPAVLWSDPNIPVGQAVHAARDLSGANLPSGQSLHITWSFWSW